MKNIHMAKPNSVIQHPFTERTIISLQKLFLINGYHTITAENVATGRLIIKHVVSSLHYYQNIAIATTDNTPMDTTSICNIHEKLFVNTHIVSILTREDFENLNAFFIELFQFDFIWIERSASLVKSAWFTQFEQKVEQAHMNRYIPIVYVSYIQQQ